MTAASSPQTEGETTHLPGIGGLPQSCLPAIAVPSVPGDVIVFSHYVKHGAFGGGTRRRLFVINASERFPDDKLPELRRHVASMARFWNDSYYGDAMLRTAGRERLVHLEQILANQDHLPALAARCRQEMPEPARG